MSVCGVIPPRKVSDDAPSFTPKLISKRRLCDAVDILLGFQNSDGGFGSYELMRAPEWFEMLSPAEVLGM